MSLLPAHRIQSTKDKPSFRINSAASSRRSYGDERTDDLSSHQEEPADGESNQSSEGSTQVSEFLGGRRMHHLLQALKCEHDSGLFFRHYVDKTGNKVS